MSSVTFSSSDQRRDAARLALGGLPPGTTPRLRVRCAANHHVAEVWSTGIGAVVSTRPGHRTHGRRDDVDLPHDPGASRPDFADLLDAGELADDELPAGCGCGPRRLSRSRLSRALSRHERLVSVP